MQIQALNDETCHITPDDFRAYVARLRGVEIHEVRSPALVIGTFQPAVWQRLRERTASVPDTAGHRSGTMECGTIDGREVLVVQFPIGAPAAAMIMEELIAFGSRQFFFAGTAGSLQPSLPIGSLALATTALREEGTSFHYVAGEAETRPASVLLDALSEAARSRNTAVTAGPVWTTDAPYRELTAKVRRYAAQGVLGVEMEAAALFAVAAHRHVHAALIVAMSDELFHPWIPGFHSDELRVALDEAVEIVLQATQTLL